MTNATCLIWGTPAFEEPTDRDGYVVVSPRAGGKYFITGTATEVLKNHDDRVRARLTSWLVEQRRPENPCPEIHRDTISEAQQTPDSGIPERADGILRYLETRSDHLGDEVTYSVFYSLYAESVPTEHEREYFGLLSHSESINKKDLCFLLDYLDQCGLIENAALDGQMGGCVLTATGYARVEELKKLEAPVEEVGGPHGKDVQPLHQLLQVSRAKLQRWFPADIRAWRKWIVGAIGVAATTVFLFADLTTGLVNYQKIKGWFNADSRPVETTGGDRTSPVQVAPSPNKDADETATPERPTAGSQTQVQTKLDLPSGDPKLAELASQIRKDVESMAKPGEKWTVSDGPRISVTLWNPENPTSGRGYQIDASNRDDLNSVMESLRSHWADRSRKDEEYKRNLFKK